MDIIRILWMYLHFVDIIIFHITRYLAFNVCHSLHSFVLLVYIIYTGLTISYLADNVRPFFHIYSSSESDWCNMRKPIILIRLELRIKEIRRY